MVGRSTFALMSTMPEISLCVVVGFPRSSHNRCKINKRHNSENLNFGPGINHGIVRLRHTLVPLTLNDLENIFSVPNRQLLYQTAARTPIHGFLQNDR